MLLKEVWFRVEVSGVLVREGWVEGRRERERGRESSRVQSEGEREGCYSGE